LAHINITTDTLSIHSKTTDHKCLTESCKAYLKNVTQFHRRLKFLNNEAILVTSGKRLVQEV